MGIGPVALALYRQLARETIIRRGDCICEIGSQDVVAKGHERLIAGLFTSLGVDTPSEALIGPMATGSSRELMNALGFKYSCIDTDGRHDAIVLDLNLDDAPPDKKGVFDLIANHGTTEHVFDQANSFRVIHELSKVGGIMIHCVPFRGYANHCFFAYHPELFQALARANGYDLLGMWVTFGDSQAHLIPWDDNLFASIYIPQNTNVLLSVVLRRVFPHEFQIPFQTVYEAWNTDANAARYNYVIDGGLVDGLTVKKIVLKSAEPVPADPGPAEPVLADPGPAEPVLADPGSAEPVLADPGPAEPVLADPGPAEPVLADPRSLSMMRLIRLTGAEVIHRSARRIRAMIR